MNINELLAGLRDGVRATQSFMAQLTEYRGGPINTEYLIVGDIARAFLKRHSVVTVEGLSRKFCNVLTALDTSAARKALKGKRTDIILGDPLSVEAFIEVKIRIKSYKGIAGDLAKLRDTIDHMTPNRKRSVFGVVVFEMHLKSTKKRFNIKYFITDVRKFEKKFEADILRNRKNFPQYSLEIKDLMADKIDGIVDREIDEDIDGTPMWGDNGHATRYYAIIIKHNLHGTPPTSSFAEMKTER